MHKNIKVWVGIAKFNIQEEVDIYVQDMLKTYSTKPLSKRLPKNIKVNEISACVFLGTRPRCDYSWSERASN